MCQRIEATLENIVRGEFCPHRKPAASVKPGETIVVETVNPAGIITGFADYVREHRTDTSDALIRKMLDADALAMPGDNDHILTGPIYVEGAMPGDVLQIDILDCSVIGDFGNIDLLPGRGGLPDLVKQKQSFRVEFDGAHKTGRFLQYRLPLQPFFGILGVAGREALPSVPPGIHGGNLDLKELKKGASLFLPVQVEGGLFYAGDGHAVQGDGEVCLSAVEACMEGTFRFQVHKNTTLHMPRVETADSLIAMGLHESLDRAAYLAIQEAVAWIMEREKLSFEEALALASCVADLHITQVVNRIRGVHAAIPKSIFTSTD